MVQGEPAEKKVHPFFSRNLEPPSTPPPSYATAEQTGQPGLEDEDVSKKRKTEDAGEVRDESASKMPKRKRGRPRRSDPITKHLVQPQQTPEPAPAPAPADQLGQTEQQPPKTAPPTSEKITQAAINDAAGKKVLKFNPLTDISEPKVDSEVISAAEVLQAGKEAFYLKEWLEGLRVQAVETGSNDCGKVQPKGERPAKKRRKNKLDGFIVNSDDDENDLDEVSEGEPDWTTSGSGRPKTVMRRVKKEQGRLNNAMVISGPHGCGKTASVYAVAKELGYEIFEINSSTRRSGKDILERVGDMTKNHLVHRQQDSGAEEDNVEDQVAKDLKSGKQGMMTAFFKAKPDVKAAKPRKAAKETEQVPKTGSKSQKQSLILVEEADILYEEDKQFWQTLMSLMVQSKRPFVVTCNDESVIPLQSLALHGILRFSMPPTELAVDVLLLIAANEGHALKRQAVEHLYMSRKYDLRATITELNYWCQIGVGDRRGGFDWFYQRWPKGIDVDEHGDTVRVISENTYMDAMGWLARDALATRGRALSKEEEALQQCWDSWRFAAGDWHEANGSNPSVFHLPPKDLDAFGNFSDALSAADISSTALGSAALDGSIDPGLPPMPDKVKEDFIIGRQLIEADTVTDYTILNDGFATSQKSLARQVLYRHITSRAPDEAQALRPLDETGTTLALKRFFSTVCNDLTRLDLAYAFDPIAASDAHTATSHLDPSVFDRTTHLIVLDVAPWVRNIVAYDHALMQERKKLSSLLSEGGQSKRMRNTRAAYSALEGGDRRSTRREKYFQGSLNTLFVLKTGSDSWTRAATEQVSYAEAEAATPPSPTSMDVDEE
ncbi:uncharacterized protein J7T54_004247 [Emericellopsis cladophorae]|uniref:AAA+ ATPase domain-containing protein n=1 Tax=Emericellopsis cladophorae TaxID=2686198 RepID=A0A9P9XYM8_9HYPO|nr:uncharacterized protein J7T54_004247 [Emericellopsis cladophorae]KAI6780115.1 hypothetical protein J7T54_004247 [Emericellopsis cladophorae]